jgi:hypothetical protein
MTQRAAKDLKTLCATTKKYSSIVERQLSKASSGAHAKVAFAESAAKYYPALKKLAAK